MIFDFHTHTFPDAIALPTVEKLGAAAGIAHHTDGTVDGLAASMAAAGIDRALVLPVATNPKKVQKLNDASAAQNGLRGIFHAGAMHPLCPEMKAEMRRIAALGLKGVKIHPVYQGVNLDDKPFLDLLYAAAENGLFVVTHAGDDIGFPGVIHCAPEMAENALRQVGDVKLILAHCGGWKNWDRVAPLARFPSVMIDTSFSIGALQYANGREETLLSAPQAVALIRAFGAKRVLFGTDSPWSNQTQALATFNALPLTPAEKADILWNNAAGLMA